MFDAQKEIELYGHKWVLTANTLPSFERNIDYSYSNYVGIAALVVLAGLASILFLLISRVSTFDRLNEVNKQLTKSDERWRFALEGSESGVWDWDIANNNMNYSTRWREMFGFETVELEHTQEEWQRLIHADDGQRVMRILKAYLQGGYESYSVEYRFRCKDGSWKWVLSKGMVVQRNASGAPIRMVGTNTDITKNKLAHEQIWKEANLDYLTNLPNRRMLHTRLEQQIIKSKNNQQHFSLLCLDLDNFKEINETLGHVQGDLLLQQASERISRCVDSNNFVARLGGDEFVVLMKGLDGAETNKVDLVAQSILDAMALPFDLQEEMAYVSASIGVVMFPDDAEDIEGLMQRVDQAMYASKHQGGNCVTYFTHAMQEKAVKRMRLASDLRVAIKQQELFVQYQPIVELSTGDVFKAEALLRWQHPEQGLISPVDFIPIAEDTKLINEIGNWVFLESIRQGELWQHSHDSRFQVAVNKSAVQFMNADPAHSVWVDRLPDLASKTNPIVVEITESVLLENSDYVANKLQEYRRRGIKIALDDFGTGYSSLSYLRKFEIDYLKIDRSFVANMEDNEQDIVLCKSIIQMAHGLGIKVVAEGIETEKQRLILLNVGCDYGQGYYFSKPLTALDFDAFLQKQRQTRALEIA